MLSCFSDSKKKPRMLHCLSAYCVKGDNVYGLGNLDSYGSIFILCFFFCTIFCCWKDSQN